MRTSIATVCLSGSLEDKMAAAAEAGFDGIEHSDEVSAEQLARLGDLAERHSVRVAFEALAWGRYVDDYRRRVPGPFFHGTSAALPVGTELVPGHESGFRPGRPLRHVYFAARVETAVWGAELATALTGGPGRGHVYEVEPRGPFEDDPNVTDKRFPGNPTESYRTTHPVRVVAEVVDWVAHPPEVLESMLASLARLREQGLDVIED